MRRTAKKTGLLITSAAAGLATLSQCSAGLLSDLFDKQCDKDRQEIEKRLPECDCSFGFFSTAWQPWGTCDQNIGNGCSSGQCRNSGPSILPGFEPGYSSGQPSTNLAPVRETWPPAGSTVSPVQPGIIHEVPNSDDSPTPILMTPQQPEPATSGPVLPPSNPQPSAISPPAANPFPRAIKANPELPDLNANPYSSPNSAPATGTQLPGAPLPRLTPGSGVPLDPPRSTSGFPTPSDTLQQPLPAPFSGNQSTGSGITLPPRRATSVTIDIPPGSAGTTLSLPDPVNAGKASGDAASAPATDSRAPALSPENTVAPPTPEPSLRPQPPTPMPSALPGPSARYRLPQFQAVPQFPSVHHAGTQQVQQHPGTQLQPFQPATHWQPVPQQQLQHQTRWRVIPGAYQQQQGLAQPAVRPSLQRRMPTPSERVIYLPPPPRR